MEVSLRREGCAKLDFEELRALSREYGVELWSFHLPFSPFDALDPSNPAVAKQSVEYLSSLIESATSIGIQRIVIHASGEPIVEEDRGVRLQCAKESLASLAELASSRGAVLAVENLPRTCIGRDSDDILALLEAHPTMRVCFDTNHLLGEDAVRFIERVGDRIVTLHVSDYDFKNERHWMPGEGRVDFAVRLENDSGQRRVIYAIRESTLTFYIFGCWIYTRTVGPDW
jgi:sugar phosphate isomerase/epimerase